MGREKKRKKKKKRADRNIGLMISQEVPEIKYNFF